MTPISFRPEEHTILVSLKLLVFVGTVRKNRLNDEKSFETVNFNRKKRYGKKTTSKVGHRKVGRVYVIPSGFPVGGPRLYRTVTPTEIVLLIFHRDLCVTRPSLVLKR